MSAWLFLLIYCCGFAWSAPRLALRLYADSKRSWEHYTRQDTKDYDRDEAIWIGVAAAVIWPLTWTYLGFRKFIIGFIEVEDKS